MKRVKLKSNDKKRVLISNKLNVIIIQSFFNINNFDIYEKCANEI